MNWSLDSVSEFCPEFSSEFIVDETRHLQTDLDINMQKQMMLQPELCYWPEVNGRLETGLRSSDDRNVGLVHPIPKSNWYNNFACLEDRKSPFEDENKIFQHSNSSVELSFQSSSDVSSVATEDSYTPVSCKGATPLSWTPIQTQSPWTEASPDTWLPLQHYPTPTEYYPTIYYHGLPMDQYQPQPAVLNQPPSQPFVRDYEPSQHQPVHETRSCGPVRTIPCHSDTRNAFLIECKRRGLSYKEIKRIGGFKEAESTLRGRFRTLTKSKEQRVRRPQWSEKDVQLLCEAVNACSDSCRQSRSYGFCRLKGPATVPRVSWKKVAQYIWAHGGSYHFGNATCKKKWCEVHNVLES